VQRSSTTHSKVSPGRAAFLIRPCNLLQLHNSPADWVREVFKPSTALASLLVEIEKNILRFGFSVGDIIMGACLHNFMAEVTWPWAPTQQAFFGIRLSSESLEHMIGFLPYLEPKL